MKDYLRIIYNENRTPMTDYPKALTSYLFNKFNLKEGQKLLEVGCGRGEFLASFAKLKLDCYGVDLSPEASKFQPNLNIKLCDIEKEKLPFEDKSFDIVYSKSLLEHLEKPAIYMQEVYRVLKPNGVIITLVPDWESNYKIYFDDYTHRTPFTTVSLTDVHKINGFSTIKVEKFRQLPIVWKYPILNHFCAAISPFIPVRTQNKFLRWSRELMLVGFAKKNTNS